MKRRTSDGFIDSINKAIHHLSASFKEVTESDLRSPPRGSLGTRGFFRGKDAVLIWEKYGYTLYKLRPNSRNEWTVKAIIPSPYEGNGGGISIPFNVIRRARLSSRDDYNTIKKKVSRVLVQGLKDLGVSPAKYGLSQSGSGIEELPYFGPDPDDDDFDDFSGPYNDRDELINRI